MYALCIPNQCVDIFTYENIWLDWRGFEANSPYDIEYYDTREAAEQARMEIEPLSIWGKNEIRIIKVKTHKER